MAAVLGALMAQVDLGVGAIGGKDSMSGSFEDLDVPPTLVSFAVAVDKLANVVSPEFKVAGSRVALIQPAYREDDLLPQTDSLLAAFEAVEKLLREGKALSVSTAGFGGLAEILFKACLGNKLGFQLSDAYYEAEGRDLSLTFTPTVHRRGLPPRAPSCPQPGASRSSSLAAPRRHTSSPPTARRSTWTIFRKLGRAPSRACSPRSAADDVDFGGTLFPRSATAARRRPHPRDSRRPRDRPSPAWSSPSSRQQLRVRLRARVPGAAGRRSRYSLRHPTSRPSNVAESTCSWPAIRVPDRRDPGGFSGGDEPDGSAKFITAFFRAPEVTEAVRDLLQARDGLMLGICNGFQALIKLGLVPYGDIVDATADAPTLTFNQIGRHQSRLVRTRICSDLSPWLTQCDPDELYTVAISHGEGRFVANDDVLSQLREGGQIATQYVDVAGMPSMDLDVNPNGSVACIEGITSPDGRVFGKMGHVERRGDGLYKNVPGDKFMPLFESGVAYFA